MRFFIFLIAITSLFLSANTTQEQLLQQIEESNNRDLEENLQRKERFLSEFQNKKSSVNKIGYSVRKAKSRYENLVSDFDKNNDKITLLEQRLAEKSKNINDLIKISKNSAFETTELIKNVYFQPDSKMSKKYSNLNQKLKNKTFKFEDIHTLWYLFQGGIAHTSSVNKEQREILTLSGERLSDEVVQIGSFNYISTTYGYLNLIEDKEKFVFTPKITQPNLEIYSNILNSESDFINFKIDISDGKYFELLTNKASTEDRLEQGGVVGYTILTLGVIGILLTIAKIIHLKIIESKIKTQKKNEKIDPNNPLGRLLNISQTEYKNLEELDLKLDQQLSNETPKIKFGEGLLKLIATVSPLLGLLGTVTGMILTFQSITTFGTNDPKLMADGISQALVTTMFGLSVAIPLMFAYLLVNSTGRKLIMQLENETTEILTNKLKESENASRDIN